MKKIIAVLLVMVMALSCVPMSLAADAYEPADGAVLTGTSEGHSSIRILEGRTVKVSGSYELKKNTPLTIDAGGTLEILADGKLTVNGTALVSEEGIIHNEGSLILNNSVANSGVIENAGKGSITNKGRISGDAGTLRNEVKIPNTNAGLMYHVRVCRPDFYAAGSEGGLYRNNSNGEATGINDNAFGAEDTGVTTYLNEGQSIYFYLIFF